MNLLKNLVLAVLRLVGINKDMTVDSAIASFKKAVERLEEIATHHDGEAARHQEAIIEAANNYSLAIDEATRARSVATKMADLVG